jgi:hypothetical protein
MGRGFDTSRIDLQVHRAGPVTVYVNPDYAGPVDVGQVLRLPEALEALPGRASRQPRRATNWHWRPEVGPEAGFRVRQYAHGGLLGGLLGTRFLGRRRMLDELRVAVHARRSGVPTAEPVCVRVEKIFGPFVRAHFVSENLPGTQDLLELLRGADPPTAAQRRTLCPAVGDAVAAMHGAGILHADLNLANILVRAPFDEPEVFIVDFDRAVVMPEVPLRKRMGNLVRLDRSVCKWPASRRAVGTLGRMCVLCAYLRHLPRWRGRCAELARRYGSRHLLHRPWRR